ncbi:hypothetical protein Q9966_013070 [Columba livia]|nr:hypothetical protein Q9966_013070 [Columba livia]
MQAFSIFRKPQDSDTASPELHYLQLSVSQERSRGRSLVPGECCIQIHREGGNTPLIIPIKQAPIHHVRRYKLQKNMNSQ